MLDEILPTIASYYFSRPNICYPERVIRWVPY